MNKKLMFGILLTTAGWANVASAIPPPVVVGNWSVIANQAAGALVINFQGGPVPGSTCRQILGTIYGDPIQGFYCPATGRIHFVRKNGANNDPSQAYIGNVGDNAAVVRMAGTFAVQGGALGE